MDIDWSGKIACTDDLQINYVRAGAGKTAIFLHGWPEFNRTWMKNLPALAEHFDVIAPDLRGFGKTRQQRQAGAAGTPPQLLARDLKGFADSLDLERFAIVSHDIGSVVAQTFALAYPDKVSALFFFNCVYPGIGKRWGEPLHGAETWYQQFHQRPFAADLIGSSREACRIYLSGMIGHWCKEPDAFDEVIEEWVDNFMAPGNLQGGFDWYIGVNRYRTQLMLEGPPDIAPIAAPTSVLWGAHDPILKVEWVDRLGEYFSNIEIEQTDDAGHFVHFEQPELANARMREFFGRVLA